MKHLLLFTFIFILPLLVSTGVDAYEFPKFVFLLVSAFTLGIFSAAYKFEKNKLSSLKIDALSKLVISFLIINLLADFAGIDPQNSIMGSYYRHQGFLTLLSGAILFFVVNSSVYNSKSILLFGKVALFSSLFISLIAIAQTFKINFLNNFNIPTYQDRIVGTFGNPNFLAGYLVMLLPLIFLVKQKTNKKYLFLKILTTFAVILTIFLTDSSATYIAIGVLLLIYFVRLLFGLRIPKIITGACIVLVVLELFQFANLFIFKNTIFKESPPVVKERGCPESWPKTYPLKIITDVYSIKPYVKREALCDNRLLIWAVGLETLIKRPLLGYGQENFEASIPSGKMHFVDNSHNIFLEAGMSSGLLGLFFYFAIITYALVKATLIIKFSLISFLIIGVFNPLSIAQISLFWVLIGFSQKKLS